MANFDDQVMALTGLTISGSSTAPSQAELTQFLTDGAKEIINILPSRLKEKCMAITALTGASQDLDGFGEVMFVSRETGDSTTIYAPCRKIPSIYGGMAGDSSSLIYNGTATDPVYWVDGTGDASKLYVKPTPDSDQDAKIFHISYPSVAYNGDGTIANFPDEAEYLVPLYAACKALQSAMGEMQTNTAIDTTAMGLVKNAIDQAATACNKFASASSDSQFETDVVWDAANSQLKRVKDALDNAQNIIDDGANSPTGDAAGDAATYLFTEEDTELLQGALGIANIEISRANAHLSEWVGIGDMRVKEINAALAEANGYISEVKVRMERDNQKYLWYQGQYAMLKGEYMQGIQILTTGKLASPERRAK